MESVLKLSLSFCAATSLMACTTTMKANHIDAGARPFIKKVDSVLVAQQDQVGADIKESSPLSNVLWVVQGTPIPILIGAGITGVRAVRANNTAKPIREKLEGFDYPEEFKNSIETAMANSNLDGIENMRLIRTEWPDFRVSFIRYSDADAVLFIDMKYAFTPAFDALYVTAHALLMPNTPELIPFQHKPDRDNVIEMSDNIYRNQFVAIVSPENKYGTREENVAYWTGLSEEKLTAILEAAAIRLSAALADDMSIDDATADAAIETQDTNQNNDIDIAKEDIEAAEIEEDLDSADTDIDSAEEDLNNANEETGASI